MRWTVDYPEDLEFVRAVFKVLYTPGQIFDRHEILAYLEEHSEVAEINGHVCQ
jgi:spore coat polysaccharide biosynthesis protein SpsF